MSIVEAIVEFLQAQGINGTIMLGGVMFHYVSLAFGGIIGFLTCLVLY